MNAHPNAKLIDIVENKRDDYQPEAIEAAETVLKNRNVKFKQPEAVETVSMTTDEIKADIEKRLAGGETFQQVRKDYREMGVDINTIYQKESSNTSWDPYSWKYRRKRAGGFMLGIGIALGGSAAKIHDGQFMILFGILIAGGGAFLLFSDSGKNN